MWVEITDIALTAGRGSGAVPPVRPSVTARRMPATPRKSWWTPSPILERAVVGGFRPPERLRPDFVALLLSGEAGLSEEQGRAVVRLVATRDLVTVMTAPAGAGKTTTLAAATVVWGNDWKDVTALAPSARAAAELATATGAPGQTVARWLLKEATNPTPVKVPSDPGYMRREVIVVDEASMLDHRGPRRPHRLRREAPGALWSWSGTRGRSARSTPPVACSSTFTHKSAVRSSSPPSCTASPPGGRRDLRLRAADAGVLDIYAQRGRVHPAASSETPRTRSLTGGTRPRSAGGMR
jgi:hypothetical protein